MSTAGTADDDRPGPVTFAYDPEILRRFPAVAAMVVLAEGVRAGASSEGLVGELRERQEQARRRLAETPIAELPSVAAWRRTFTAFGTKPTQHRNAAEALLRRVGGGDDLPSIDALVDVGNAVSLRHALPVAVFDLDRVVAPVTVRFAAGGEPFDAVGGQEPGRCDEGEVVFVDAAGEVVARRWCWRQSRSGATTATTTRALFVVEAQHATGRADADTAGEDLVALLEATQPTCRVAVHRAP